MFNLLQLGLEFIFINARMKLSILNSINMKIILKEIEHFWGGAFHPNTTSALTLIPRIGAKLFPTSAKHASPIMTDQQTESQLEVARSSDCYKLDDYVAAKLMDKQLRSI